MSDLSSPLLAPDPPTMDRRLLLEEMENRYRVFITETLRCLADLKRELREWFGTEGGGGVFVAFDSLDC